MSILNFNWDQNKAKSNIAKHKVSFKEASTVFDDIDARLINDPDHSEDEERLILIGMSDKSRVLTIVHCVLESEDNIRIISARKSTKKETTQYKEYLL